jgi:hypothetical protein
MLREWQEPVPPQARRNLTPRAFHADFSRLQNNTNAADVIAIKRKEKLKTRETPAVIAAPPAPAAEDAALDAHTKRTKRT